MCTCENIRLKKTNKTLRVLFYFFLIIFFNLQLPLNYPGRSQRFPDYTLRTVAIDQQWANYSPVGQMQSWDKNGVIFLKNGFTEI